MEADFIAKILGSRNDGFIKRDFFSACILFELRGVNWATFIYRANNHDTGFYFDNGAWWFDDRYYYRSFVKCIQNSNNNNFGMSMGSVPFWLQDESKKKIFRELFPLTDFTK